MKPTIAISMDMDWAPDAVIADSLDLLAKFNLRATLFMTHRTPLVEKTAHELGIHPQLEDVACRAKFERLPFAVTEG